MKPRQLERPLLVSSTVHSFSSSASSSAECVLQREERRADEEEEETGGGRTRGVPSARAADGPGDELGSPVHLQQVRASP